MYLKDSIIIVKFLFVMMFNKTGNGTVLTATTAIYRNEILKNDNLTRYFIIDGQNKNNISSTVVGIGGTVVTNVGLNVNDTIAATLNDSGVGGVGGIDDDGTTDLINNEFVQIIFCILYTTVFVLGVFGNVLVCYVVLRNKAMQTVTNIFITNLALSDILLCVLAVPFTPLYTFMGGWAFGKALCHLVPYAQGCSIYISTLTLTSIAIDRYFVIIYPFHPRMKLSTCILIIISIWIVSLLATLPYGLYVKVFSMKSDDGLMNTYCEEDWPSEHYRKVFGSVTTILQFILPFFIISICYTWVSLRLNARAKAKPGSKNSKKEEADRDRKKRTNRMLISMVAVFGISWLPINVVNIFNDFYARSNEWRFYTLLFFIAHSIAMSSTCYNPFLYAWLNENFRKEFKHVLPCFNPSNNHIINNLTRSYRSQRSYGGGGGGGDGRDNRAGDGGNDDDLENENIIQDTACTSKRKDIITIIPREPTFGNRNYNGCSGGGRTGGGGGGGDLSIANKIDILLSDDPNKRKKKLDIIDDIKCSETPFISSDNTTSTNIDCPYTTATMATTTTMTVTDNEKIKIDRQDDYSSCNDV